MQLRQPLSLHFPGNTALTIPDAVCSSELGAASPIVLGLRPSWRLHRADSGRHRESILCDMLVVLPDKGLEVTDVL
jgi:hypothetical protein